MAFLKHTKLFWTAQHVNYSNNDINIPSLLSWHHVVTYIMSINTQIQKHIFHVVSSSTPTSFKEKKIAFKLTIQGLWCKKKWEF